MLNRAKKAALKAWAPDASDPLADLRGSVLAAQEVERTVRTELAAVRERLAEIGKEIDVAQDRREVAAQQLATGETSVEEFERVVADDLAGTKSKALQRGIEALEETIATTGKHLEAASRDSKVALDRFNQAVCAHHADNLLADLEKVLALWAATYRLSEPAGLCFMRSMLTQHEQRLRADKLLAMGREILAEELSK